MTDLVGLLPNDAFSLEDDIAGSDREKLIDTIECRGLSTAVRADKTKDFSFFYLEGDIINGQKPAKGFGEIFNFKNGLHIFFRVINSSTVLTKTPVV